MLTAISEEIKRSYPDLTTAVTSDVTTAVTSDASFNSLVIAIEKDEAKVEDKDNNEVDLEDKVDDNNEVDLKDKVDDKVEDAGIVETIIEAVTDTNTKNIVSVVENVVESDIFEDAIKTLNKKIGRRVLTPQYLMIVVKYAMEIVEAIDMKGSEQREFVIDLLKRVVIDAPLNKEYEQICLDMINSGAIGQTIDLIIDATHGRINVNHVEDLAVSCCFSFLGLGKNKRKRKH